MGSRIQITIRRIAIITLCVLAFVYVIYHIANSMKKGPELFTVRPHTAEDAELFTGYLFRDETVLFTDTRGVGRLYFQNGEKIPAGSTVIDIYRDENAERLQQLKNMEKQIFILKEASAVSGLTIEDVQKQIESTQKLIAEKKASGNMSAADALGDSLLILIAKKDLMLQGRTRYDIEISSWEQQCTHLIASLGLPIESVRTPISGYFREEADGYERYFTADAARTLSLASFDRLISREAETTQDARGTLISDSLWYFAAKVPATAVEGFDIGSTYSCRFPDNRYTGIVDMSVYDKQIDGDLALIVLASNRLPQDFDMTRCQRIEIVRATYSGYRIPASEVRVRDGITYVYIFRKGCARERAIDIIWEQNGYYIVSETYTSASDMPILKLNDLVIIGERGLYDGMPIG